MALEFVRRSGDREGASLLDGAEHGSFEPREGKIEVRNLGMRQFVGFGVAILSAFGDRGAAGVGQTEDFGDLVETFADGIVAGGADDLKLVMGGHVDDLSVATRDDEGEKRKGRCL